MAKNPAIKCAAALFAAGLTFALATGLAAKSSDGGTASGKSTRALSPKPKRLPDEVNYIAKMDAMLAPLSSYAPSAADMDRLRDASEAIRKNDQERFVDIRAAISDPVARKLIDWMRLRSGSAAADEYRRWLDDNPNWPLRSTMTEHMEEALFTDGGTATSIKGYFKSAPPETGMGYAALASAYLAEGNKQEARKLAVKAWREMDIPPALETGFLERFNGLIDDSDHKWRFDRLLTDDVRWRANRKERSATAKRIIQLLSAAEQKKATARLAVFNKSRQAKNLMHAVPSAKGQDWGLVYHRVQILRKAGKTTEAATLILSAPTDPKKIPELDEWWAERRELAYDALKEGNFKLAYQLTKDAGPLTVNPLNEQRFMAGWIALRYLNDKAAAQQHFTDFAKSADGPLSRAKSAYWQGRAAEARGDKAAAAQHYRNALNDPDTFHALLSMQKLEPGRHRLTFPLPPLPTGSEIDAFNNFDLAKAAVLSSKLGLARNTTRIFLVGLRNALTRGAEASMVAHLAELLDDTQMALRNAKAAIARGQNLYIYGYPVHPFPAYKPLRDPPEIALLLGIARQETEFEQQTISGAGAKGLLQVMTITAKHVCRDYKIRCDIKRLMKEKDYNTMIASAYVADRMDDFSGSYVIGLASYNAGPGRARQWIRENGDPRNPNVDVIDWIERIPISETRNYVTKVLSNIQVYRARLGETDPLRLNRDLTRGRSGSARTPGKSGSASNKSSDEG